MKLFETLLLALVVISIAESAAVADTLELGRRNSPPAIIAPGVSTPIASAAQHRLESYFKSLSTGAAPNPPNPATSETVQILLGDASIAKEHNLAAPDETREESFTIAPVTRDRQVRVVISGATDKGIKQGVYYLLRNLVVDGDRIVLQHATARSSPAIKLRVSHIGGAMSPRATPQQLDWNMVARWDPQRIGDYIDMLDFFGYNAIEEPPTFYRPDDQSDGMLARRKALREHLLRNGQLGVAKIDGTVLGAGTYTTNTPYGADTKEQYARYYRSMAETAAPYNDIVLTHWVDPGGWPDTPEHPCTLEMLQDLHNQIAGEFRRVNPQTRSILSLWNLQNPSYDRWKGYQPRGVETILGSGKLAPDVGIAQSRIYRADEAKKVLAAGHPLAIWGWYTADNELTYTMHIHTHQLQAAMRATPKDASEQVSFYSMDNCQREFNIYSVYVAARLLWDPRSDPETHLRDIARLIYGPKLEEPVFRALEAIADVRCGTNCRGYFAAGKDGTNGVVDLDQGLAQSLQAWNALADLHIDRDYIPPLQIHRPPDVLLEELKGQLHGVAAYMQFLKDKRDGKATLTEVPRAPGAFEYYERRQYLADRKPSTTAPAGKRE